MNKNHTDLNRDAKRLDRLIKICEKNIIHESKEDEPEDARVWGYMDRLEKLTRTKSNIVEILTGVKKILRKLDKDVLIPLDR